MYTLSYGQMSGVGSPQVQKLQVALAALSQASGQPIINPGGADGIVGPKTINAVAASLGLLKPFLGSLAGVLQASLSITSLINQAQAASLVTQYASQLEQAARAATLAIASGQGPQAPVPQGPMAPLPPAVAMAMPWYKTWWGMGAIAVGAVGVVMLIATPRRAPAAT